MTSSSSDDDSDDNYEVPSSLLKIKKKKKSDKGESSDDDSSSSDVDPFSFKSHSFQRKGLNKVCEIGGENDSSSSEDESDSGDGNQDRKSGDIRLKSTPTSRKIGGRVVGGRGRGRGKKELSVEEKISALKSTVTSARKKRPHTVDQLLNEDDDSDIEIMGTCANGTNNNKKLHAGVVALDSDDDSDDDENLTPAQQNMRLLRNQHHQYHAINCGTTPPTNDALRKARAAREKLQNAQHYHAEDVAHNLAMLQAAQQQQQQLQQQQQVAMAAAALGNPSLALAAAGGAGGMHNSIMLGVGGNPAMALAAAQAGMGSAMNPLMITHNPAVQMGMIPGLGAPSALGILQQQQQQQQQAALAAAASADLGPTIMVKLRTIDFVNGKMITNKGSNNEVMVLPIRAKEPFQRLLEKYVMKRGINLTQTTVTFQFDGETLNLQHQTPTHMEMDNDDLIDVICKTIVVPGGATNNTTMMPTGGTMTTAAAAAAAANSSANLGKALQVTVRTQEIQKRTGRPIGAAIQDIMFIKEREQFQKLFVKYKEKHNFGTNISKIVMEFDGEPIQMNKTPTEYDMENEDIIDVKFQR